jgi:hypothetical protein
MFAFLREVVSLNFAARLRPRHVQRLRKRLGSNRVPWRDYRKVKHSYDINPGGRSLLEMRHSTLAARIEQVSEPACCHGIAAVGR